MGNYEQKQRVNVSGLAQSVLESDYVLYGAATRAGFYNRILASFFDRAKASVDIAVKKYASDLQAALPAGTDPDILKKLIRHYRAQLCQEIEAYPQGESILFRLNNDNYQRLYDEDDKQRAERNSYSSVSKYLKALFEEYARLSPAEREAVYYAEDIEQRLQTAIDAGYALDVTTNGMRFLVTPYAVLSDMYGAHMYLVGLSRPFDDAAAPRVIASFRLSRLEHIRHRKTASHRRLTSDDRHDIEKKLRDVGVQYLLGNSEQIRLRLTPLGRQLYNQRSYMRPQADRIDNDGVYTFSCTSRQIEQYFLSFGKEAEILEPASLRKHFADILHAACELYTT